MMLKGKKILVVDDEPDLREILKEEFTFEGADVSEAKNGNEAFQIIQQKPIELVLSDIRMPGGDGVSLLRNIKAKHLSYPSVILITGFADISASDAYEIGAEGFFAKPFQLEDLLAKVNSLLLPINERWKQPLNLATKKSINKTNITFQQAINESQVSVGRGGIFLSGDLRPLKLNEVLQIQFSDGVVEGGVRWTRFESSAETKLPMGVGLEISHTSPEINAYLSQKISALGPKAFIPKSTT